MFNIRSSIGPIKSRLSFSKAFSITISRALSRAVVYQGHGAPSQVLRIQSYPHLPPPPPQSLNLQFILSPINPADINVIEGIYPSKPRLRTLFTSARLGEGAQEAYIAGNEGLARITSIGAGVPGNYKVGDWVVMLTPQLGTWCSTLNVKLNDVLLVPNSDKLSEVQAATMMVNPPTAYNMLHGFVKLSEGDWVIQNGANSAVGQCVIQIAAALGYKTINLVRERDNLDALKSKLQALGATQVLTYNELRAKDTRELIKSWTDGKSIRLGLNCVGGPDTTHMLRSLGEDAHLVTYGGMSKNPLTIPTSPFIFKNLIAHGFWQTRWYESHTYQEIQHLVQNLTKLMAHEKLAAPEHEIVSIKASESDSEATRALQDIMAGLGSKGGKKTLLQFQVDG